jgi:hypothetical protein
MTDSFRKLFRIFDSTGTTGTFATRMFGHNLREIPRAAGEGAGPSGDLHEAATA